MKEIDYEKSYKELKHWLSNLTATCKTCTYLNYCLDFNSEDPGDCGISNMGWSINMDVTPNAVLKEGD